jgi:hypothetical protein
MPVWTPNANGDPRAVAGSLAGCLQQRHSSVNGLPCMIEARHAWNEQANHLVTDELVDDRLALDKHLGCRLVEAIEEIGEVSRRHSLSETRGAAHVRE